jgi:hypothetical protein
MVRTCHHMDQTPKKGDNRKEAHKNYWASQLVAAGLPHTPHYSTAMLPLSAENHFRYLTVGIAMRLTMLPLSEANHLQYLVKRVAMLPSSAGRRCP